MMTRLKTQRGRSRRAFTLIELLVVIMIIAILAAMIVPKIIGKQDEAKIAKAATDINALATTLDRYRLDTDGYPMQEEGLEALMTAPADVQGWSGPYLNSLRPDPWGQPYIYEWPGPYGENSFYLYSGGPDQQPGTDDDIYAGE